MTTALTIMVMCRFFSLYSVNRHRSALYIDIRFFFLRLYIYAYLYLTKIHLHADVKSIWLLSTSNDSQAILAPFNE